MNNPKYDICGDKSGNLVCVRPKGHEDDWHVAALPDDAPEEIRKLGFANAWKWITIAFPELNKDDSNDKN